MTAAEMIVAEIEHESQATRKLLECIPEDRLSFQAHAKSMTVVQVASHIAETYAWAEAMVNMDEFVMDPAQYTPWVAADKAELLAGYDKNLAAAIAMVRPLTDAQLGEMWTMTVGDRQIMSLPRGAVIKSMLINHVVHHRAQLGVYLRLCDVSLPPIYGPSADAPWQ
jgi:uncharacterized damage-inducible protein DinB